ncbi:hypothetical protein SPAR65_0515 [Streptococcus pneumoniae GA40563]|nr:hypothetical protein SPAR41_0630 [Streptococcus pneumoniae GA16833]EHE05252.1 hypothetical protein SPAR43_0550 [Streptococcus pneumoniae GA17227]EHZ05610.1 hypothetical protein SPAR7_0551 [Streptococcus pneumoniae GA05245]EHZ46162.1 hypothetical protein SPAR65_0515 [Streptococcus pneumoniae GA40563]EJH16984.1 hypothetical protein SPAR169_0593 [Streptococcus pneumoniae GA62331]CIW57103.1 Uncharacterised protein [Streptococcus pneumoniae]
MILAVFLKQLFFAPGKYLQKLYSLFLTLLEFFSKIFFSVAIFRKIITFPIYAVT